MREFVARENIRRFQKILLATTDAVERAAVSKLLAAEKEELAAIGWQNETSNGPRYDKSLHLVSARLSRPLSE